PSRSPLSLRDALPILLELARRVLEHQAPVEREVQSRDDRWYLVRLLPYRTDEDEPAGVVATFVDVTERKQAEVTLRRQQQELEVDRKSTRLNSSHVKN